MCPLFNRSGILWLIAQFSASVLLPAILAALAVLLADWFRWSQPAMAGLAMVVAFAAFGLSIEPKGDPIDLQDHTARMFLTVAIPTASAAVVFQVFIALHVAPRAVASIASVVLGAALCALVVSRLFARPTKPSEFRGRRLITFEEALERAKRLIPKGDPGVWWGGLTIPSHSALQHFFVCGVSGSGKTLTLRLLTQSLLSTIKPGNGRRAVVYDVKQDAISHLAGMNLACPVIILDPFDTRAHAWDIATDVTSPAIARQVAEILLPAEKNASQPFFSDAARHLLSGVLVALTDSAGTNWTFADVVLAMRSRERIQEILLRTDETKPLVDLYFGIPERISDIIATIATKMAPFEPIAAAWQRAPERFSLHAWCDSEQVIVLGHSESMRSALQSVNQVLFRRLSDLILSQSDSDKRRTFVVIDEFRQAGFLDGINALLTNSRSRGGVVCLGFQDLQGVAEVYGDKCANEILGQCSNRAILRLASPATAKWASDSFGPYEKLEERKSVSSGSGAAGASSGNTTSAGIVQRAAVLPSEFFEIPQTSPENGLTGYYLHADIGAYRTTVSGAWLKDHLVRPDADVPNVIPRPEAEQHLRPWSPADLERLGLAPEAPASPAAAPNPARKRRGSINDAKGLWESDGRNAQ